RSAEVARSRAILAHATYQRQYNHCSAHTCAKEAIMLLLLLLISLPFLTAGLIWYVAATICATDRAEARTIILAQGLVFGLFLWRGWLFCVCFGALFFFLWSCGILSVCTHAPVGGFCSRPPYSSSGA